jgi:hypothetical protein
VGTNYQDVAYLYLEPEPDPRRTSFFREDYWQLRFRSPGQKLKNLLDELRAAPESEEIYRAIQEQQAGWTAELWNEFYELTQTKTAHGPRLSLRAALLTRAGLLPVSPQSLEKGELAHCLEAAINNDLGPLSNLLRTSLNEEWLGHNFPFSDWPKPWGVGVVEVGRASVFHAVDGAGEQSWAFAVFSEGPVPWLGTLPATLDNLNTQTSKVNLKPSFLWNWAKLSETLKALLVRPQADLDLLSEQTRALDLSLVYPDKPDFLPNKLSDLCREIFSSSSPAPGKILAEFGVHWPTWLEFCLQLDFVFAPLVHLLFAEIRRASLRS